MPCRIRKALVVSGLTLAVGPFCLVAQAQDYIDVEAERREAERREAGGGQQSQPPQVQSERSQSARSYPVTSYGVDSAPAESSRAAAPASAAPAPSSRGSTATGGGSNVGRLLIQVQQLQQEVMRLNGLVEQQGHELRTLKEQQLERYVDLDRRVSALTTGGADAGNSSGTVVSGNGISESIAGGANAASEQPGEADAYRAAYALVRSQEFDQAVSAFKRFLRQYPSGRYAANAHYWLGELYLVVEPPDLEASRQAFSLLLQEYPDNAKVPDALYKLGRVHYMKGNRERAREYLDRVVRDYGNTSHGAVKLAREFIDENY